MSTQDQRPRPYETASATTDPDNANSGPFAYIITGIVVACLLVCGVICSSCASIALSAAGSTGSGSGYGGYTGIPFQDDDFGFDEWEEWLERYGGTDDSGSGYGDYGGTSSQGSSGLVSVADALDFDLFDRWRIRLSDVPSTIAESTAQTETSAPAEESSVPAEESSVPAAEPSEQAAEPASSEEFATSEGSLG